MKFRTQIVLSTVILFPVLACVSYYGIPASAFSQKEKLVIDNCAELQRRASKTFRHKGTTFQGFERLKMDDEVYFQYLRQYNGGKRGPSRLCQIGYITSISPMGKQICKGYIFADVESRDISWGHGYHRASFRDPVYSESEFCRYIN